MPTALKKEEKTFRAAPKSPESFLWRRIAQRTEGFRSKRKGGHSRASKRKGKLELASRKKSYRGPKGKGGVPKHRGGSGVIRGKRGGSS